MLRGLLVKARLCYYTNYTIYNMFHERMATCFGILMKKIGKIIARSTMFTIVEIFAEKYNIMTSLSFIFTLYKI